MSESRASADWNCPDCGARLDPATTECWLCHRKVALGEGRAAPRFPFREEGPTARTAEEHAHFQFSLASLMLLVTLTAVMMGVSVMAPGLGIALAVLVTPAFIHTAVTAARRRSRGQPMAPLDKIAFFGGSLGAVVVTLAAAGTAFYATCWAGFLAGAAGSQALGSKGYDDIGWGLLVGVILGAIVGIAVLVLVIRVFVRMYRRRKG